MKILIPTEPDDTHAILVKLALDNLGHDTTLLFTADQPTKMRNSVFIDDNIYKWQSVDRYNNISDNDFEVVWWRRARRPFVPKRGTHRGDYSFVSRENDLFFESFTSGMASSAWWINSKEAARRANFKLLQLKIASQCDMQIPTTLCSNDPKEIQAFIRYHGESGVIYKPLCSNFWFEKDSVKISYTARVTLQDLPRFRLLQQTPGIFQKELKKKYELRVTCFGDYIVPAKIDSQAHDDGKVDWRAIRKKPMTIEKYTLPLHLEFKIRSFMHEMGLVFGAFDFIVTEDDEYIFLEVNEQGQFLWIEEINPDFKMLDIFINFILNKSVHFEWDQELLQHSVAQYKEQIVDIYEDNMQKHISLNMPRGYKPQKIA